MAKEYLSIGEVLGNLKAEFPDVTISKIRFLETERLIHPQRTPSGYRKFYPRDVERLRAILRMQRQEYLPLRVIRDRLEQAEETRPVLRAVEQPVEEQAGDPGDDLAGEGPGELMTADELATAAGVKAEDVDKLASFGFLPSRVEDGRIVYGDESLEVLRVVKEFFKYGLEPRHLTMYRHFADREAALFEALVLPMLRQRNPEARRLAAQSLTELAGVSRRLKQAMLRAKLRESLGESGSGSGSGTASSRL